MKENIANLWADKLESNEYEQGYNCLCDGNKFCCLGVLADLYVKETGSKWVENDSGIKTIKGSQDYWQLPKVVRKWAGLKKFQVSPVVVFGGNNIKELSELNDKDRLTFKEIAKLIREQKEDL